MNQSFSKKYETGFGPSLLRSTFSSTLIAGSFSSDLCRMKRSADDTRNRRWHTKRRRRRRRTSAPKALGLREPQSWSRVAAVDLEAPPPTAVRTTRGGGWHRCLLAFDSCKAVFLASVVLAPQRTPLDSSDSGQKVVAKGEVLFFLQVTQKELRDGKCSMKLCCLPKA